VPNGAVLWTRLVGGAESAAMALPVDVDWEVARDERFERVDRRGTAVASPALAHSVHVEVGGLEPDREYWYRFRSGGEESGTGRFRTAPGLEHSPADLRFAFASCQHYEQGHYTSLRHLAEEDLRFVIHLGDYIYEDGVHEDRPRRHDGEEIVSLDQYRRRYALYKSDADLQAAHAAGAWIVTWDDHEVDNNYAADAAQDDQSPAALLARRAAAYQAFYEHMPVRNIVHPRGPVARLYRRLQFGDLIDLSVVDTRQYRSDQPCDDRPGPRCAGAFADEATMFGEAQERWLFDGLSASRSRWKVLANQVAIAQIDNDPGPGESVGMDRWDGYVAARRRLLEFVRDYASNVIVLTGDIHSNWVADLKADFADPAAPIVGTEFIGTSLSSGGDGAHASDFGRRGLAANPHLRFFNGQRGYVRCHVARDRWTSDYRVVQYVTRPGSPISTRASFVVEHGRPGAQPG
jgi:alkaline phosphatase D